MEITNARDSTGPWHAPHDDVSGSLGSRWIRRARRGWIVTRLLDLGVLGDGRGAGGTADLVFCLDFRLFSAAYDAQRHRQETGSRQGGDELLHGLPSVLWVLSDP